MAQFYTVERLAADKVDQAFPLMQALEPTLERERWREIFAAMTGPRAAGTRSILVASGPRGHFRALCLVELVKASDGQPAAAISKLFIDNALDPDRVAAAVLEALAGFCKMHMCTRLRIELRGTDKSAILKLATAKAEGNADPLEIDFI